MMTVWPVAKPCAAVVVIVTVDPDSVAPVGEATIGSAAPAVDTMVPLLTHSVPLESGVGEPVAVSVMALLSVTLIVWPTAFVQAGLAALLVPVRVITPLFWASIVP